MSRYCLSCCALYGSLLGSVLAAKIRGQSTTSLPSYRHPYCSNGPSEKNLIVATNLYISLPETILPFTETSLKMLALNSINSSFYFWDVHIMVSTFKLQWISFTYCGMQPLYNIPNHHWAVSSIHTYTPPFSPLLSTTLGFSTLLAVTCSTRKWDNEHWTRDSHSTNTAFAPWEQQVYVYNFIVNYTLWKEVAISVVTDFLSAN